jgi:hypothetical protein
MSSTTQAERDWFEAFIEEIEPAEKELVVQVGSRTLAFRITSDYEEIEARTDRARGRALQCKVKQLGTGIEAVTPCDERRAMAASIISDMSTGENLLTFERAMILAAKQPKVWESIVVAIGEASKQVEVSYQVREVERAKNESSGTRTGDTA